MKSLRVVADDFGVNWARNAGIVEGRLLLSHASLILNGASVLDAVEQALSTGLTLGLHFNITEGAPLDGTSDRSRQLLDQATGNFLGKAKLFQLLHGSLPVATDANRASLCDGVLEQLELQIKRFVELTGSKSIILDGHHHVQALPIVHDAIQKFFALADLQLRYLRIPHDPSLPREQVEPQLFSTDDDCFGRPFWTKVSSLSANREVRSGCLWPLSDAMIGFDLMGKEMCADNLRAKLLSLPSDVRRVELMTHVGYPLADAGSSGFVDGSSAMFWKDEFSRDDARRFELAFILSGEFLRLLDETGFSLLTNHSED